MPGAAVQAAWNFSYGFFFQRPSFSHLFSSPDFKIGKDLRALIGNADLGAESTVQYEVGIQQQLAKFLAADLTVYYKDSAGFGIVNVVPFRSGYGKNNFSIFRCVRAKYFFQV